MGDRRSFFSRFLPAPGSRRAPETRITAPPPETTDSTPKTTHAEDESEPVGKTKTPERQAATAGSSLEPTRALPEPRKSPSRGGQMASQLTNTTFTNSIGEPKTSSPSGATKSPSSSNPASPYRRTTQSRSPPQPSSPSKIPYQTTSRPKRSSQPPSPSRLPFRSPKQRSSTSPKGTQPTSPSKEAKPPTQEISTSLQKEPNAATTQQVSPLKSEVKFDSANDFNRQTKQGTSFTHDEMELKPPQSSKLGTTITIPAQGQDTSRQSKSLDSSSMNGGRETLTELNPKPEETKYVKEVVQAMNTEANEETKKEVNEFLIPKSGSEAQIMKKADIPSKSYQMHGEKQEALDTKEIVATSPPCVTLANTTTSQPTNGSTFSGPHNISALRSGKPVTFSKTINDDMSKFVHQMVDPKKAIHSKHVSVITLAGENRGSLMQMEANASERERPFYIHRNYKINPDESAEAAIDEGRSSQVKNAEDAKSTEDQSKEAYVNNNSQGVNNSIVFNSSITEGNPGVHMGVIHVPREESRSPETRKAEFNTTSSERRTHEPMVRRRCLRGLFLETSDSDSENPQKPRRHGCRVGCEQKG